MQKLTDFSKGAHRALGTHISQTICLELDGLENPLLIEHIIKIGNKLANQYWLSHGSRGNKKNCLNQNDFGFRLTLFL